MAQTTRRHFTTGLAALSGVRLGAAAPAPESDTDGLIIHELNLPPDVLADLKSFAEPVLEQARSLKELPLQGTAPGFVFIPK
jgi:hypothetical protein